MEGLELSLDAAEIDAGHGSDAAPKRSGKTRLLSLADIDRRTRAYQRTAELIASVESDLGGSAHLSTGERQIVQRAAVTGALIEDLEARWLRGDEIDPATYCTLSNAQRRLFETVGLKRVARDVSADLDSWAAEKAAEKANQPHSGAAGVISFPPASSGEATREAGPASAAASSGSSDGGKHA